MTAQINITTKDNMVIVQIIGHTTLQDFYALTETLTDGEKYIYNRRFYDFRKCQLDLSTEEMEALSEKTKQLDQGYSKVALLADSDLSYGLSRMFEVLREHDYTNIHVFRDEDKAMEWILSD